MGIFNYAVNCTPRVTTKVRTRHEHQCQRVGVQGAVLSSMRDNGRNQRRNTERMHEGHTHGLRCTYRGHRGFNRQRNSRPNSQHAKARDAGQADSPVWALPKTMQEAAGVGHAACSDPERTRAISGCSEAALICPPDSSSTLSATRTEHDPPFSNSLTWLLLDRPRRDAKSLWFRPRD